MMDILPCAALLTGTFLFAGLVKGVIGLGLPTVAMGLLGLAMLPVEAAALLLVPSLVTNVWQLLAGPRFGDLLLRLWPMMVGVVAGTVAGSGVIAGTATGAATAFPGVALALYGLVGLAKFRLRVPPTAEPWAGPLVGTITGLVTGATGVFVIPAVPYLGSLGLERDDLVQALGLSFTVSTLALAGGLALHDALPLAASAASLLAVLPAFAGMALGGWLRARVRPETFRLCFFVGLLALGSELVWRGLAL
ncbi:sulfite exporter TauE/SafE family protein [Roseicella aerolata]|uniref:Probable membrane transporter protein n=1 Tax=Roseicella aerolata TaxID=2883479 RepID=A0A9X1IJT5_9PROT|nr:sulfite exporter TauE/SafE family protein [Roseicella aerolata]MCB4825464.1 sulfite exporter TauE/SafE family protein [Roseicella aerolata]